MENQLHNFAENPVTLGFKLLIGVTAIIYLSNFIQRLDEPHQPDQPDLVVINETEDKIVASNDSILQNNLKPIEIQPHCHISYVNIILKEIVFDLYVKHEMCTPEDVNNAEKHKIPKVASRTNKITEPKGTMVVYIAVGLLLTSLGAAFVEVFKAKQQPQAKCKPPLARTCSLADLTVLRHNRKEVMRRDSFMETTDHRGPSKLLDRQSPLLRRCSFPVGPGDFTNSYGLSYGSRSASRKASVDNEGMFHTEHRHTHFRLLHRH